MRLAASGDADPRDLRRLPDARPRRSATRTAASRTSRSRRPGAAAGRNDLRHHQADGPRARRAARVARAARPAPGAARSSRTRSTWAAPSRTTAFTRWSRSTTAPARPSTEIDGCLSSRRPGHGHLPPRPAGERRRAPRADRRAPGSPCSPVRRPEPVGPSSARRNLAADRERAAGSPRRRPCGPRSTSDRCSLRAVWADSAVSTSASVAQDSRTIVLISATLADSWSVPRQPLPGG